MTIRGLGRAVGSRWAGVLVLAIASIAAEDAARGQLGPRPASKFHPDSSFDAERLLLNASKQAQGGQWAEAIDLFQRVIAQHGEAVALVPREPLAAGMPRPESLLYVDAREYCQRQIAAMPPEARALYRRRVDDQAERWFRDGAARRDRDALRKVIDQAFCSSWGDDALDLLGDLAFQDGRFGEALLCYRRLAPDPSGPASGLIHPDPSVDLARVSAKILLCRDAIGELKPGNRDLDAFRLAHPAAQGRFAGREGPLAEILAAAIQGDHLAPLASVDSRWPTFAGSPSRSRVAPASVDVGSFQWRVRLEPVPTNGRQIGNAFGMTRIGSAGSSADRALAYHPIVLGDLVVVAEESRITAYPLNQHPATAAELPKELWDQKLPQSERNATNQRSGAPRYTLTAAGDRIFARLGRSGFGSQGGSGTLIAVRNSREIEGKLLWRKSATEIELPRRVGAAGRSLGAAFEGTPVADLDRVYVALTEAGAMTAAYIACLDAETGATRWTRFVGEANSGLDGGNGFNGGMPIVSEDTGRRLLSLDGPTIYYQTNLGALAALDAATGTIRWIASYPAVEAFNTNPGRGLPRDLNPAVVQDGLVFVAPEDALHIFAFHAATGRLAWKSDQLSVTHLLGVAKGRVIATGNQVFTLDARTGKALTSFPDGPPGETEPFGRGVLAGNQIYWPTRKQIWVLDQETGKPADDREPIRLGAFGVGGGNLAVGDGYLIVAQPDALVVFCQNSRLIERYRDEIALGHDPAANALRLARVAEATGKDDMALEGLAEALKRAGTSETIDGQPLLEAARRQQHLLFMKLGIRASASGDWATAVRRFEAASEAAPADKDRLAARLRLARALASSGGPAKAVDSLQAILADARLRGLNVVDDDGQRTVRADLLVADRLGSLLKEHGRGLYAAYDREAADLLKRGRAEKSPRAVEEIGRTYPAAEVLPEALLYLGSLHESLHRPADAARDYRRLLASPVGDPQRARALVGLGRSYEAQRLWVPARDAFARALSRHPDVKLEELGEGSTVGSLVSGLLSKPPFDRMTGDRSEPSLPVPLGRRWEKAWPDVARPLPADGVPPSAEAGRVLVVERTVVRPVDARTGASAWRFDLKSEPIWAGYLADRLLIASESRLVALSPETGAPCWEFDASTGGPRAARRGPNPFVRVDPDAPDDEKPPKLREIRVVGPRVVCVRGDREVLAIDGDTGQLDWSYALASGSIGPRLHIGPRRLVLQARKKGGNAILVIDVEDGRCRRVARPDEEPEWARDPVPIDDDHLALALDARRVASFDLEQGREAWVHTHASELPYTGPPLLLADSGRLLALFDGGTLQRLEPATGATLWSATLGPEDLSESPEALTMDGDRLYGVSGSILSAYSLRDGSLAWRRRLTGPESGWSLALTDRCVLAYPSPGRSPNHELDALPLAFYRRDDGAPVQRLLLQATVRDLAVRLDPRGAVVATQDHLWALGERPAMDAPAPGR